MNKKKFCTLAIMVVLLCLPGTQVWADYVSTFDTGTEGWASVSGAFSWSSSFGNPAGSIQITNSVSAYHLNQLYWSPTSWQGNWSSFINGSVSFDVYLESAQPPQTNDSAQVLIYFLQGPGVSQNPTNWVNSAVVPITVGAWNTITFAIDPAQFTSSNGDTLQAILANLNYLNIIILADMGGVPQPTMVTHLDNVSITSSVPEPSTMLLLASGLFGLIGFRRKFRK
jgi:hypothetical protein